MCGLAFVMRKDGRGAVRQLIKAYEKQKTRGQLGFGYVAFSKGEIDDVSRSSDEKSIYRSLKLLNSEAIMFHHRYPTSTPNFKEGAHPIYVSNKRLKYDYYVIHNGVISNDDALKKKHEELGYKYTTQMIKHEVWETRDEEYRETTTTVKYNDSEAFAIELAEGIESNSDKIGAFGSIAFVCIQADKDNGDNVLKIHNIFFGRNTNPLTIEDNNSFLKLSSEGGKDNIDTHTLYAFDILTNKITKRKCDFGLNYVPPVNSFSNPERGEWVAGTYKNGEWIEGHWESKKPHQSTFPALPRGSEDEDERIERRIRAIEAREELEAELQAEAEADGTKEPDEYISSVLTGEETLQELKDMQRNLEEKIEDYDEAGLTEKSNDLWIILAEVDEALRDWELNIALDKIDVENPPDYSKTLIG